MTDATQAAAEPVTIYNSPTGIPVAAAEHAKPLMKIMGRMMKGKMPGKALTRHAPKPKTKTKNRWY